MKPLSRQLPPLHTLVFFDAVARLGSFTRAAESLHITQSAVSKQVRALEADLGLPLFRREGRQVALTEAGAVFAAGVGPLLRQLAEHTGRIRGMAAAGHGVTVVCTQAVAHYWLFPRVVRFNMAHPEVAVNIFATDEVDEAHCRQADLGILYDGDSGIPAALAGDLLFAERIHAVCAPDYPVSEPAHPVELAAARLIHLDPESWKWHGWEDWFRHFGVAFHTPRDGLRFNALTLALSACQQGMGIALGWGFMTDELVARGELRRLGDFCMETGRRDYLVHDRARPLSPAAQRFRVWLLGDVAN